MLIWVPDSSRPRQLGPLPSTNHHLPCCTTSTLFARANGTRPNNAIGSDAAANRNIRWRKRVTGSLQVGVEV